MKRALLLAATATVLGVGVWIEALDAQERFPHQTHSVFFAECNACHAGVSSGKAEELFPQPSMCAPCHDGATAPSIRWKTPAPRESSLRFTHTTHPFPCAMCHLPESPEDLAAMSLPQPETCLGCHAPGQKHLQVEDCGTCHAPVTSLRVRGPGGPTPFHGPGFTESHGPAAGADQPRCSSCHAENTCIQCHDAQGSPGFHPLNFLASHGREAFGRVSDCTSCHQQEAFCRECHLGVGLQGGGTVAAPFHSNQPAWILSHPQAARQDLESCVSCHQQSDCLRCHSASIGMRVSPHGPGFNASGLADRNLGMCRICHGPAFRGGGV